MYIRRSAVYAVAALAFGCSGEVGNQPGGPDGLGNSGTGASPNAGSGGSSTQTGGAGGTKAGGTGGSSTAGTGTAGTGVGGTGIDGPPVNCAPDVPATSQIPRLTNQQYDRTVRDLLGLTTLTAADGVTPSTRLATDQSGAMSA
ncbi:MAG TPA: DUF1587 domain-containing protein, partial [Polyangiaceae bacterium]